MTADTIFICGLVLGLVISAAAFLITMHRDEQAQEIKVELIRKSEYDKGWHEGYNDGYDDGERWKLRQMVAAKRELKRIEAEVEELRQG